MILGGLVHLAIVKVAGNSEVVNIGVEDSGHLEFLDGAHTALGVEHKDRDVLLAPETVNGGRASVTAGRSHNGEMVSVTTRLALVPPDQEVLEQVAQKLQCHVLEGESGAVEELEKMDVTLELDERCYVGGAESSIAATDDVFEVVGRDFGGGDVKREDVVSQVGEGKVLPLLPPFGSRNRFGNVETAVGSEALENNLLEGEAAIFSSGA